MNEVYLALSLLSHLHALTSAGLDIAQLMLELADTSLKLGHGGASAAHGVISCLSQTVLQLTHLGLKSALGVGLRGSVVLLGAQFISQAGRVNHGLLGLLLAVLGLVQHVVNFGLHGVHVALHVALLSGCLAIDGLHLIDGNTSLAKFSLGLALAALSRVKESAGLLHLGGQSLGTALMQGSLLVHLLAGTAGLLIAAFGFAQLSLN